MIGERIRKSRDPKSVRYGILFGTLVFLLLTMPFLDKRSVGEFFLNVLFLSILVGCVQAVRSDRRLVGLCVVFGSGLFASPAWGIFPPSVTTNIVSIAALIGFSGVVIISLSLDVFRAREVSAGSIFGACSVFFLLGLFWYGIFSLIEVLQPDSFAFAEYHPADLANIMGVQQDIAEATLKRSQIFYFTYVTITTLGFGDVRPVSDVARIYTTIAAMSGQLFLVVLVARLVGIQSAQVSRARKDD